MVGFDTEWQLWQQGSESRYRVAIIQSFFSALFFAWVHHYSKTKTKQKQNKNKNNNRREEYNTHW